MAQDENRLDYKRVREQANGKQVERMKQVEEEEIQDREKAIFCPIPGEHESGKDGRFPDKTPRPADIHLVHLAKPGGDFAVNNSVRLILGQMT